MGSKNSKPPLVSVIIATYNRERFLSQAIESVLKQTCTDYEIVVVNNGSSDGTEDLLRERFAGKLVYIHKDENVGLPAARNAGIKVARGKYLAMLDDDDCWLPEKLEMQIGLFEGKPSLGLVYCNSFIVNEKDEVQGEMRGSKRGAIFNEVLSSNCLSPPSGVLVSKKVVAEAGYFDETLTALEDWDLWIRVSQLCDIDFVDQPELDHSSSCSAERFRPTINIRTTGTRMSRITAATIKNPMTVAPPSSSSTGIISTEHSSVSVRFPDRSTAVIL